ncbi:MAG: DNA starvation/stationary phase protection protein Dps [Planctomyces sp.]|nr:DNA starvation/stationary phase protection protein Dps [Planctomyces sp.]MBA4119607.1 DNA starvation/stationary phase protection protein Dps [Isosphaera sp.]
MSQANGGGMIRLGGIARQGVIGVLQGVLTDMIDLFTHAKVAHWNVKGPAFIALHELFDQIAERAEDHADTLAERIAALGGRVEGTARHTAGASRLGPYPAAAADWAAHARALAAALAVAGGHARQGIDDASAMKDAASADVLTEVVRDLDKDLWLVESHLGV